MRDLEVDLRRLTRQGVESYSIASMEGKGGAAAAVLVIASQCGVFRSAAAYRDGKSG